MADSQQRQGDDLFIIDNSDSDWKVISAPSSVEYAFSVAGQFAKQLESAYWIFYETHLPAGRAP